MRLTQRDRHFLLRELMNFLQDLPSSKFHMPDWADAETATETHCGTAGCAFGWGVSIHHRFGLSFSRNRLGYPLPYLSDARGQPLARYSAFSYFYGVSWDQAFYVTSAHMGDPFVTRGDSGDPSPRYLIPYAAQFNLKSSRDITPAMAASRIREVLSNVDPSILDEEKFPMPARLSLPERQRAKFLAPQAQE